LPVSPSKIFRFIKDKALASIDTAVTAEGAIPLQATLVTFKRFGFKAGSDEAANFLVATPGSQFNLSTQEIQAIKTTSSAQPDAASQAFRKILLQRWQAYRKNGLKGIATYDRGEARKPILELLSHSLKKNLRRVAIFRDIDDIPPGVEFDMHIMQVLGSCNVLFALIGPNWLTATDNAGCRRLDDPNDFTRLEIATALKRDVRVIPLLVDGGTMPMVNELPDDLKPLTRRQAFTITDEHWDKDCRRLTNVLKPLVQLPRPGKYSYVYEGKTFSDRKKAEAEQWSYLDQVIAGIKPRSEPVAKFARCFVPSKKLILHTLVTFTGPVTPESREELGSYHASMLYRHYISVVQIIKKRNIFEYVQIEEFTDVGHIKPESGEVTIYLHVDKGTAAKWFYVSTSTRRTTIESENSENINKWRHFLDSIEELVAREL
jgi:hypothetical protein